MSDAWRVASIHRFEQVSVAPATALLRISAVSAFRMHDADVRPTLVADNGHEVLRFVSVPAPADKDGLLRCAYPVPVAAVTVETVFSLEFEDGFVIALPAPIDGAARLDRSEPPATLPGEPQAVREERRSELAPKLTELTEELASARREAGNLRDDAELGRGAQAQILHLHLEAVEARAELQAVRDLATLTARISAPGSAAPDVDTAMAPELAQQPLADGDPRAGEAGARADSLQLELSAERAQHLELRERFAQLEADARAAAERFVAAERERDAAITARHEAEAEHDTSGASLVELETWNAELERRLAETTTQLADARAASDPALSEPDSEQRTVDEAKLAEIRDAAVAEAHRTADRDLAEAAS